MSLKTFYQVNEGPPQPCRSFNRNLFRFLLPFLRGQAAAITDIGGTSRTIPYAGNFYYHTHGTSLFNGGGAQLDDNTGIVVGSGAGAEDFEAAALDNRIRAGSDGGELYYDAQITGEPLDYGTHNELVISRRLINYTAAPISINEFGLYLKSKYSPGGSGYPIPADCYFMVLRDVLAAPLTLVNGNPYPDEVPGQKGSITLTLRTYL